MEIADMLKDRNDAAAGNAAAKRRANSKCRRSVLMPGARVTEWLAVFLVITSMAQPIAALAQVTISISPASLTTSTNSTEVFTVRVSGATNTAVTWEVNGLQGGGAVAGVISTTIPGTSGSALYLAPAQIPSGGIVTVTAVSQADTGKAASAAVTIEAPSRSGITYYVSTTGNDLNPGTLAAPFRTIQHAANTAVAGDAVQVRGGVYNEKVHLPHSGNTTSGYISFTNYPGETAVVDGTGISCCGSTGQDGLFSLTTNSYIIIEGFEIRNYATSTAATATGIDFEGAGSHVQILNNHIHNIETTGGTCRNSNALAVAVYGERAPASINHVTFTGNEADHNATGCSETVTVNGNVQYWIEANNLIHDDNNIGMDFIGFEGTSPRAKYDQARDGWIFANQIYNISSSKNAVYAPNCWCADGFYADGGTRIIIERNLVHDVDINEAASENSGHVSSYVTIRNNVIYHMNGPAISIGGYANSVGGSDHIVIVNNTLYNDSVEAASGEFQIQFHATNNEFKNNVTYGTLPLLVNDYTASSTNPAALDYNDWYYSGGSSNATFDWQAKNLTGYSAYQSASAQDAHSPFADPQFVNRSATPPNLDTGANSQANNLGQNLGPDVVGVLDFSGNPRVNSNGQINAGAYEQ
jgi:Protein of unknown function (DUF1565)/Right handed beta helix region